MRAAKSPPVQGRRFDIESRVQNIVRNLQDNDAMADVVHHPDQQLLCDWALYGPKNPRVEQLVSRLAREHGLRVAEIEDLIIEALEQRLRQLE